MEKRKELRKRESGISIFSRNRSKRREKEENGGEEKGHWQSIDRRKK